MSNNSKPDRVHDCNVCYGEHCDDIHDATLRIHRWLRHEVTRKLTEGVAPDEAQEDQALIA
jgi:hypothetical protein